MRTLAGLFVCFALTSSGQIPDALLPETAGVNIHFVGGHERDLDLIQAAGFRWVRMDFHWAGIERQKGEYHWSEYEELISNLEKRGLRALFILDYSNPLYEETVSSKNPITGEIHKNVASPRNTNSVAAFARWAGAAAERFRNRPIIWEIWNEPNIHFWSPEPNVREYTALALATCAAIRKANPKATIVAPATSGFPWEFLETFFKAGALDHLDGVSVHPYRDYRKPPESAAADYDRLRELIDRYAPAGRQGKIPILSGEWGYATHEKGLSLDTQAAFTVRQQLVNLLNHVPLSIWYDWKNDGPDPKEREHNFGTVFADLKPKPAYVAIQTLTRELSGFRLSRRVELEKPENYALLFTNSAGATKLAAWTTGEAHSVTLKLRKEAEPAKGVKGLGETFNPLVEKDMLRLELAPLPQYVGIEAGAL